MRSKAAVFAIATAAAVLLAGARTGAATCKEPAAGRLLPSRGQAQLSGILRASGKVVFRSRAHGVVVTVATRNVSTPPMASPTIRISFEIDSYVHARQAERDFLANNDVSWPGSRRVWLRGWSLPDSRTFAFGPKGRWPREFDLQADWLYNRNIVADVAVWATWSPGEEPYWVTSDAQFLVRTWFRLAVAEQEHILGARIPCGRTKPPVLRPLPGVPGAQL